jgi:cytochrome c-type biogenesis protein CcmH
MKIWTAFFLLCVPALAQEQNLAPSNIDPTFLSAIRKELACDCGCGMTVQDCLGGMICSESRTYSNEVISLLESGKTREQVLQAMVAKYGEKILSAPTKKGFNLMAWTFPFLALVLGGVVVWRVVAKWKTQSPASAPLPRERARSQDEAYGKRFEDEFEQFSK